MFSPTEVLSAQPDIIIRILGLLAFTLIGLHAINRLVRHLSLRRQQKSMIRPKQEAARTLSRRVAGLSI